MIINRDISRFIVYSDESLLIALQKISENKSHLVFSVSSRGNLEGVLTDGDLRRWLLAGNATRLDLPVNAVSNKKFIALSADASDEDINSAFSDRITVVPLLDKRGRIVSVAHQLPLEIKIGSFVVSDDKPSLVIAEIGNNHNGSVELAIKLIDEAINSNANCIKFQMRTMGSVYIGRDKNLLSSEDLGSEYTLDLLSRFQLDKDSLFRLFDYCQSKGVMPLCTPWDHESLSHLDSYGMPAFKLASADLTNHELLEAMARTRKPIICSTGMSSESEIISAVGLLKELNASYILLHCNSTYPTPFKDVHLNYMDRLKQIGSCPIGYSGHERGYHVVLAAIAKGAKVIEKHFTLDRDMEGNDHRVSLLPSEFLTMVRGIREIELSLGTADARRVAQGEMLNREVLAKSIIAASNIRKGEVITDNLLDIRSPGKGLAPYRKRELIGRLATRDLQKGEFFYPSDIEGLPVIARKYNFKRPFGIPVRYHDIKTMSPLSNFDLLEFHLSYKDLEEPIEKHFSEIYEMNFVIHSPELFSGDHVMDLCSKDKIYRERSINELQRVINIARQLGKYFNKSKNPLIIINAGGFSLDDFTPASHKRDMYKLVADSLSQLDSSGVEIIPQTMPPYPWHFGGQRHHNLFVLPEEIFDYCNEFNQRICLDISHSALACNHAHRSLQEFLEIVGPYIAHLHLVDAEGIDGEGLQIGDGSIDFAMVAMVLERVAPNSSFIPEIWQGHKNSGEGFWVALERLERWF